MIETRKAEERGHFDHGWLNTYHTFSFADYYDRRYMGFGHLRVINQDQVHPGKGFPTHGHRDMEIISYVLDGALEHKDSMGNGSIIRPGDVQRMSAGSGVTHSEFNPSRSEIVHFLQIWILPEKRGLVPSYEQKHYSEDQKKGRLCLVASREGRDGSVKIHQDANLYAILLEPGQRIVHTIAPGRKIWLQVARGDALVNNRIVSQGDGIAATDESRLFIEGRSRPEVLLFDLA
jgi:redox-sensitive bicupin YhaK (pirin superfamily)